MQPQRVGWYWFLPDENCATPTGLLRLDKPVVVLVGVDKVTRDMPPARFVVRFPLANQLVGSGLHAMIYQCRGENHWVLDRRRSRGSR